MKNIQKYHSYSKTKYRKLKLKIAEESLMDCLCCPVFCATSWSPEKQFNNKNVFSPQTLLCY